MQTFRKLPTRAPNSGREPDQQRPRESRSSTRRASARRLRLVRQRQRAATTATDVTRPSVSARRACRSGSTGTPRNDAGPHRALPSPAAACPRAAREVVDARAAARRCRRARRAAAAGARRPGAASRSRRTAGSPPTWSATTGDRRPAPASSRPATAATTGAPGTSLAFWNQLGGRLVVVVVPVVTNPMSCMYSHLSGRARNPFSSSAIARSGRPGRRDTARREDRAEPVGDVEARIERGREVEQRVEQRVVVRRRRGEHRRRLRPEPCARSRRLVPP